MSTNTMVTDMKKKAELPLVDPLFSTYHSLGPCTAIAANNPSIRNWYLNETATLMCSRKFLNGFTSPEIFIPYAAWWDCPHFEVLELSSQFLKGYTSYVIREMIDQGYYVLFSNVDDYYVEGKSWYKEHHFSHDGMICGYDQEKKSYCIYAYDSRWIYQKFWTSQKSFNAGCRAMIRQGVFPIFYALKVNDEKIELMPHVMCNNLKKYLDSNLEKYPFEGDGDVFGIVVHLYIAEYVDKLYKGEIPYERMDRRVFRAIWEHKKVMLERIKAIEKTLCLGRQISSKYADLVSESDTMRMLYASHNKKRRDSVLLLIKKKLLQIMEAERDLLNELIVEMERSFANGIVGIS